jgi:hypothetical protein
LLAAFLVLPNTRAASSRVPEYLQIVPSAILRGNLERFRLDYERFLGRAASRTPRTLPILRLSADPAKEPSGERTEYQSGLGRERNVSGHAYKDAEHYPDQRAEANKEPRSASVFLDSHTDHPRLRRNSRSRTRKGHGAARFSGAGRRAERESASHLPGPRVLRHDSCGVT